MASSLNDSPWHPLRDLFASRGSLPVLRVRAIPHPAANPLEKQKLSHFRERYRLRIGSVRERGDKFKLPRKILNNLRDR
jgi:hypothetical protein